MTGKNQKIKLNDLRINNIEQVERKKMLTYSSLNFLLIMGTYWSINFQSVKYKSVTPPVAANIPNDRLLQYKKKY